MAKSAEIFGNNLHRLRKEAKLTQEALAKHLGVERATIVRWEQGKKTPSDADIFDRLSELFSVPVYYLWMQENERPTKPQKRMITPEEALKVLSNAVRTFSVASSLPKAKQGKAFDASILFCDDDTFVRDDIAEKLRKKGFQVTCVGDGSDALELIKTENFDIVISDNFMPNVSGVRLMTELVEKHPDTIRIVASGSITDTNVLSRLNLHAYFSKPYDARKLINEVVRLWKVRLNLPSHSKAT